MIILSIIAAAMGIWGLIVAYYLIEIRLKRRRLRKINRSNKEMGGGTTQLRA